MNSIEFLDAVRNAHGLDSDNKLAAFLGIERPRVSQFRTGRRTLDPASCEKVAAALDVPVAYVLASIEAERAKRPDIRAEWERAARILKTAAACAVLGVAVSGGSPARAASPVTSIEPSIHYAPFNRRRRRGYGRRRYDKRRPRVTAVT